jgi:SAM-dependent methyltransferase
MKIGFGLLAKNARRFLHRTAGVPGLHFVSRPSLPYPVSIRPRDIETESLAPGWGPETFDRPEYVEINRARLTHLASLEIVLQGKTVLDIGCGVGDLAQFFVARGCRVVCVDGRSENISRLHQLYPDLQAHVANVETESLAGFGTFDIVFAYGLLYHLENPLAAWRNMGSVCQELLLLETMVCDHVEPILRMEDESGASSQGLKGLGCRPSPSYVVLALNRVGFPFVYAPQKPPEHPDFRFEWRNKLDWQRNGHNLRCVFVASRKELENPQLVSLLRD